jgi:deoxyribonuclease (pyrimidine dimer)
MTRINLIPPSELMDQHLFAEWREIKMVPQSLKRSLVARGPEGVLLMVPPTFRLNTGHVSFFYDKGAYLRRRYQELTDEILDRGVHSIDADTALDAERIFFQLDKRFHKDFKPTEADCAIIRERIALRISQRPNWYRYKGRICG